MENEEEVTMNNDDGYHASSNNVIQEEQKPVDEKERAQKNNEQNLRNAADIAIATKNPYAMAAGAAVKLADKVTGGKSTEMASKAVTQAIDRTPGGKFIQDKLNKVNESGLGDKAGQVASMVGPSKGAGAAKAADAGSKAAKASEFADKANKAADQIPSSERKQSSTSSSGSGSSKLFDFVKKNPHLAMILLCSAGGLLLIFLIILMVSFGGADSAGMGFYGLYGYEYVEPKCKEITVNGGPNPGTYTLEEYVAGVVQAEFGVFINHQWREAAKAGAVAARSYVQNNVGSDCNIESSSGKQNFSKPTEQSIQVADETRGLVLIDQDKNIVSGMYDAFCTDYNINLEHQDDTYYIVCQKEQKVPKSWADNIPGIASSWKSGNESGAHGQGMSAWGAAYLSEVGFTFDRILSYYYDNTELGSVYASYYLNSNWTQTISRSSSSNIQAQIASRPLKEILSKSQYDELNSMIYENVMEVGVGSKDAVVMSAVIPIKYLAENFKILIPYTLAGGHYATINSYGRNVNKPTTSYYGVDPDWGSYVNFDYQYHGSLCHYDYYGPDCSAWVPWTFHNGGTNMPVGLAGDFVTYGERESMCGSYIGKPGDIIESSGHVTLLVGVDESQKLYYIAHASGGSEGVKISTVGFCDNSGYWIVNMDKYYSNPSNINTNYQDAFERGVIGY